MKSSVEVNFDGLVGPTHYYGGVSFGNMASFRHQSKLSNPRAAALQGLEKMKFLMDLGLHQGVFPPHERPHLSTLRKLGFNGKDKEILKKVRQRAPELFKRIVSASSMWAANAATVIPSVDAHDGKVHFIPANLQSKLHRSIEASLTSKILKMIFPENNFFTHHEALGLGSYFSDEGAANHIHLNVKKGKGVHLFVYGHHSFDERKKRPIRFPSRQSFEASEALVRLGGLKEGQVILAQQNPDAIDAGVFHNDVISMGSGDLFIYHEKAFLNTRSTLLEMKKKFKKQSSKEMNCFEVSSEKMSLKEAVQSYFFNSQMVALPKGEKILICPLECQNVEAARVCLERLISRSGELIQEVHFLDLRQSMNNGGGPACLRLKVPLTEVEMGQVDQGTILNHQNYSQLVKWVKRHYREALGEGDFDDPHFIDEIHVALDELTQILKIGSFYEFQN